MGVEACRLVYAVLGRDRDFDPEGAGDGLAFLHRAPDDMARALVPRRLADRRAGKRGYRGDGDIGEQLEPDVGADVDADRNPDAGCAQQVRKRRKPGRPAPVRLAHAILRAAGVVDGAGSGHFGRDEGDAADGALGRDCGLYAPAGIDALDAPAVQPVKIPVRQPVHGRHHGCFRPEQRRDALQGARKLMALQRDEDGVLRAEFGCIAARRQPDRAPAHAEAARAYGVEMRPARHDRNIRARARQRNREVPTDGARAVNRNPHEVPSSCGQVYDRRAPPFNRGARAWL